MSVKVTITWHNAGPHTIWGQLAARLGREPTHKEANDEVKRILFPDRYPPQETKTDED